MDTLEFFTKLLKLRQSHKCRVFPKINICVDAITNDLNQQDKSQYELEIKDIFLSDSGDLITIYC